MKTGKLLWGPLNQTIPQYQDITFLDAGEGVYVLHSKDTNEAYGYSLSNGQQIWGPVKLQGNAFSYLQRSSEVAYGQIYIFDFGGYVHALDLKTGKINWVFTRGSAGYDNPYGIWPIWGFGSQSVGDGKLFLSESHMYDPPMSPGFHRLAINTTDGSLVWKIQSFSGRAPGAIADGMLVQWNSYDKQLYTFGQGQTATTTSVSNKLSVLGEKVLAEGMVTDESPGTKNSNRIARFPNGVPAVSEESQEDWMEYVYMEQPRPTNTTGVQVVLSVIDPNNNAYEVGRTTTDANGMYQTTFVPDIPGEYTLIASFPGSTSYYRSSAETSFVVENAPATPTPTAAPAQSTADLYFVPAIAGLFVAIIVVGLLIILFLRKRP
jgi:outer membrane protein assembly factor BamB